LSSRDSAHQKITQKAPEKKTTPRKISLEKIRVMASLGCSLPQEQRYKKKKKKKLCQDLRGSFAQWQAYDTSLLFVSTKSLLRFVFLLAGDVRSFVRENQLYYGILHSVASLAQGASLSVLFGLGNDGMPCAQQRKFWSLGTSPPKPISRDITKNHNPYYLAVILTKRSLPIFLQAI